MQLKILGFLLTSTLILFLCACTTAHQDSAPTRGFNADTIPNPTPKPLAKSEYGNPDSYVALGKRYYVAKSAEGFHRRGVASWYGTKFHGRRTSSGEPYNMFKLTAANRTLPIPTYAKVTNLENGRSIIVKINDRGPFLHNRLIDLSYAAAKKLHFAHQGTAHVDVKTITFGESSFAKAQPQASTHRFFQVGVFSKETNALKLKSLLKKVLHKPVMVQPIIMHNAQAFRVKIGPLVAQQESATLRQLLKHLGLGHPIALNP